MFNTYTDSDGDKVTIQDALFNKYAVSCEKADGDYITVLLTREQVKELGLDILTHLDTL